MANMTNVGVLLSQAHRATRRRKNGVVLGAQQAWWRAAPAQARLLGRQASGGRTVGNRRGDARMVRANGIKKNAIKNIIINNINGVTAQTIS